MTTDQFGSLLVGITFGLIAGWRMGRKVGFNEGMLQTRRDTARWHALQSGHPSVYDGDVS
jgi:hypothetical protein